jgi:hypothetical protein
MASLLYNIPNTDSLTEVQCQTSDDLPAHVKGAAQWFTPLGRKQGYFVPGKYTLNNTDLPVELINNVWYSLTQYQGKICTHSRLHIPQPDPYSLRYWNLTDPQHPDYQAPIIVDPPTNITYSPSDPPIEKCSITYSLMCLIPHTPNF